MEVIMEGDQRQLCMRGNERDWSVIQHTHPIPFEIPLRLIYHIYTLKPSLWTILASQDGLRCPRLKQPLIRLGASSVGHLGTIADPWRP